MFRNFLQHFMKKLISNILCLVFPVVEQNPDVPMIIREFRDSWADYNDDDKVGKYSNI